MTKSRNEKLHALLSSVIYNYFDSYVSNGLTVTSSMYCHAGVDELGEDKGDHFIRLQLCDTHSDVGTYQFYTEGALIVVADYFERDEVYGKYDEATFNAQYDVGLTFRDIAYILTALEQEKAYAYLTVDSKMITHRELMDRTGWYDRRIKKHFPNVQPDELDHVKYYPLDKVLVIEQTI